MINVVVWNEFGLDQKNEAVKRIHPQGIHETLAQLLREEDAFQVVTATLDMPSCGLSEAVLEKADVLIWWGHMLHEEVPQHIVRRVQERVLQGMGLIVLHSAHGSRIFRALLGTGCGLRWHELGEKERIFNIAPEHPVMRGVPEYFELEAEEMYGERFDIPAPDALLGLCWYPSGEVFRGICTFTRGAGKIVYLQPGHETMPSYHHPIIRRIIKNAVRWSAEDKQLHIRTDSVFAPPLEKNFSQAE